MSIVYVMVGFTGSGKSTWAREFAQEHPNTKIVSPDSFREMLNGEYKYLPELDEVITLSCFDTAYWLLDANYDVIIDCGNLTNSEDRRAGWRRLNANRFIAVMMPMDKPPSWYIERRKQNPHWPVNIREILENEMRAYDPPTKVEEFDEIWQVMEDGEVCRRSHLMRFGRNTDDKIFWKGRELKFRKSLE